MEYLLVGILIWIFHYIMLDLYNIWRNDALSTLKTKIVLSKINVLSIIRLRTLWCTLVSLDHYKDFQADFGMSWGQTKCFMLFYFLFRQTFLLQAVLTGSCPRDMLTGLNLAANFCRIRRTVLIKRHLDCEQISAAVYSSPESTIQYLQFQL